MEFQQLIRQHALFDVISVGETHYALATDAKPVPGCLVVLAAQLPAHLQLFLRGGFSHRFRMPYSQVAGLSDWILFSYSLTTLAPSAKQRFSHALMGVGGRAGMLRAWRGQKVGRCAFLVPSEFEGDVIAFCTRWNVPYTTEVVFRGV